MNAVVFNGFVFMHDENSVEKGINLRDGLLQNFNGRPVVVNGIGRRKGIGQIQAGIVEALFFFRFKERRLNVR